MYEILGQYIHMLNSGNQVPTGETVLDIVHVCRLWNDEKAHWCTNVSKV